MTTETAPEEMQRLPGLFRIWDLSRIIVPGTIYRIEDAGLTQDGAVLFAIYQVIVASAVH